MLQLRSTPGADAVEIIMIADLHQLGRPERLDHRCRGNTDYAVAVQVLLECGLDRFERRVRSRHRRGTGDRRDIVATAVGCPYRVLVGPWFGPGDIISP